MRTKDILQLALAKGQITSCDVVRALIGEVKERGEYRGLLAQASTLLRRLHKRGMLEREWVRERRGQYVYAPSDAVISSLLPALGVLEEGKRRKDIQQALTELAKEIVLGLRMEDNVKAMLWNPFEHEIIEGGLKVRAWIVVSYMKNREIIERKAKEHHGLVTINPIFISPKQLMALEDLSSMWVAYGWSFVSSTRRRVERGEA